MAVRKKKVKEDNLGFLKNYLEAQKDSFITELIFEGKVILIKQYLPYLEKLSLVELVTIGSFLEDESGITKYNCGFRELLYNYNLIRFYTNLELNNDFTEIYDLFKSSGLLDQILLQIPLEEITMLEYLIGEAIEERFHLMKRQESFSGVVKSLLGQLSSFDIEGFAEKLKGLEKSEVIQKMMETKIN